MKDEKGWCKRLGVWQTLYLPPSTVDLEGWSPLSLLIPLSRDHTSISITRSYKRTNHVEASDWVGASQPKACWTPLSLSLLLPPCLKESKGSRHVAEEERQDDEESMKRLRWLCHGGVGWGIQSTSPTILSFRLQLSTTTLVYTRIKERGGGGGG